MASTPSTRLRLELQAAGENLNTWGAPKLNAALSRLEEAVCGRQSLAVSGSVSLTTANYSGDQAHYMFVDITSGSGGTVTIPSVEKVYLFRNGSSGSVIVTTGSGSTVTLATGAGAVLATDGASVYKIGANSDDVATALATAKAYADSLSIAAGTIPLRGHISGLILSTGGSSATFGITAGQATDSAYAALMTLTTAYTKTTAAWAVGTGAGSLDTGLIANSSFYHVYLIRRPDTGVVDVIISTSATSPTLPTSYTQYRRVGTMKTNGSAQWTAFLQRNDHFYWAAAVRDISTTPTSGVTNTVQLTVPTGYQVEAVVSANTTYVSGGTTQLFIWDPALTSTAPAGTVSTLAGLTTEVITVFTDTSANIKTNLTYGGAVSYFLDTLGWIDVRGRNS